MPELPEVETVVRDLAPQVVGKRITDFILQKGAKRTLSGISELKLKKLIKNKTIISVARRAKYILLETDVGHISIHLRMTGRLICAKPSVQDLPYIRAIFMLGKNKLYFKDVRRFGKISFISDIEDFNRKLGPEPLSNNFKLEEFQKSLANSNKNIKAYLLDQKKLAGVGNIYADEALWQAKIHPLSRASKIKREDSKNLYKAIRQVLNAGIKHNGTTFNSFVYGEDSMGDYVNYLNVFAKEGELCKRCSATIVKLRVAQRGTHICPKCQKIMI